MTDKKEEKVSSRANVTCSCGKVGYPSETQAKYAHRAASDRLRFYLCTEGGVLWHSTNDEKHRKRGSRGAKIKRARRRQKNRTDRRQARNELRGW